MNKQRIWLAWARLFLALLVMGTLACEVPTDGKFEDKISGAQRKGTMPAPELTTIGKAVKLTWATPEKATYQNISRYDDTVGDWYQVGSIFTEGEAFPILEETATCTFYDYFTEEGKTYIYRIEGGYYDYEAKVWDDIGSEDSVEVAGVATDDKITGSSAVTYDSTTGRLTFQPPLTGPAPHVSAGTPKVMLEFSNGPSSTQKLYDGPRSEIDLTVVHFEDWFTKTVPIDVYYSPVYEQTSSTYRLHILSYPNNHYELTGDTEGLTIPGSSTVPPAMPENISAEAIGDTWIKLTWNQVVGASKYNVYRADPQYGTYDKIASDLSIREYTDKDLSPSTTYWYKVGAYNDAGESQSIQPIAVTTSAEGVTLLPAPTQLRVTKTTESSISLTWNSVSDATSYNIYRSSSSTYSSTVPLITTSTETSYEDTGLIPYTSYTYWVSAYNESGEGPKASVSGRTETSSTGGGETLAAPTGVTATAQADGSIRVSWSAVSGAIGYEIRFATSENGSYYSYEPDWTTKTEYIDWDVSPGQTWYYKVLAYNEAGSGPLSSEYGSATVPESSYSSPPPYTQLQYNTTSYGYLYGGETVYYYFEVTSPGYYNVSWEDSGTHQGYADIQVGVKYWNASDYLVQMADWLYDQSFYADHSGYIIVEVQGYVSYSSGQFGVTYRMD